MSITVGDIYKAFPTFKTEDMIKLMNGRSDFNGSSKVSLTNIASYNGGMANELSIFAAKKEGKSFISMLSDTKQENVQKSGVMKDNNNQKDKWGTPNKIPMGTSIFNINNAKVNYT